MNYGFIWIILIGNFPAYIDAQNMYGTLKCNLLRQIQPNLMAFWVQIGFFDVHDPKFTELCKSIWWLAWVHIYELRFKIAIDYTGYPRGNPGHSSQVIQFYR